MKSIILTLLFFINLWSITFVDESQYVKKLIGTKDLKGAKFLGETIWQDEPINEEINFMTYKEAKRYCKKLRLLGIKGWRLPLKTDFMLLDTEKEKLRYIAKGCDGFGYCARRNEYYTQTPISSKKRGVYIANLDNGKIPIIKTTKYLNTKMAVRCVLNPNIYNQAQKQQTKSLLKENSLDGYLNAYLKSKNEKYLKKAISKAKTIEDKRRIETTLFNFLGFSKLFELRANGKIIKERKDNLITLSKNKSLKYRFTIRPKPNSILQLKYNSYKVVLKFNLNIKQDKSHHSLHIKKSFLLSPKTNYSTDIIIDFRKIEPNNKNLLSNIKGISSSYMVDEIEVIE